MTPRDGITGNDDSLDIEDLEGLNMGGTGIPPEAGYPQ